MGDLAEKETPEMTEQDQVESTEPDQQVEDQGDIEFVLDGDDGTPASDTVPLAAHLRLKEKLKGTKQQYENLETSEADLKAQLAAKDQELQLLKLKQAQGDSKPVAPSRKDFQDDYGDVDEGAYQAALNKWSNDLVDYGKKSTVSEAVSTFEESQRQKQQEQAQASALDSAIQNVVKEADELKLKNFDESATAVANLLPEGAYQNLLQQGVIDAKTTVYLAKNPAKVESLIRTAQTKGDAAAISELTMIRARLKPKSHTSPPDPDAPINGAKGASGSDFQGQLDALRASDDYDVAKAIAIREAAVAAGVTVR